MNKQKIIDIISKLVNEKTGYEKGGESGGYSGIDDYAGGNIDDAYHLGCRDGEIVLAREIAKALEE